MRSTLLHKQKVMTLLMAANTVGLFSNPELLTKSGITALTAKVLAPPATVSNAPATMGSIVGGVGGAVVLAGVCWLIINKWRGAELRNGLLVAESQDI